MKYIIGRKIEMKQQYADNGMVVPFTLIQAGPCIVTQVKTTEKDGYSAVQFGFGEKKKARKPLQGHLRGLTKKPEVGFACIKEMRLQKAKSDAARGDSVRVGSFAVGDIVDVTGTSKGRGFAGVVKRHHFHGQKATHGHKDQERMPGSISSGGVQHVFKGKRMGGRMGGEQVTVKKLKVVLVDPEQNILAVYGAIPGARNGIVVVTAHVGDMIFEKSASQEASPSAQVVTAEEVKEDSGAQVPVGQESTAEPVVEEKGENQPEPVQEASAEENPESSDEQK